MYGCNHYPQLGTHASGEIVALACSVKLGAMFNALLKRLRCQRSAIAALANLQLAMRQHSRVVGIFGSRNNAACFFEVFLGLLERGLVNQNLSDRKLVLRAVVADAMRSRDA